MSVGFVICHRSLIIRHFQKIADLAETLHPPETAIQTVTLQRQDVLFHHGDTEGTEISQRHQGSPCIFVYSARDC